MYAFLEHLFHLQIAATYGKWIWFKEEYNFVRHHIIMNMFTLKTTVLCWCYWMYYILLHLIMTAIANLPVKKQISFQVVVLFLVRLKWRTAITYSIAVWCLSICLRATTCELLAGFSKNQMWSYINPCLHTQILDTISQNKTLNMKTHLGCCFVHLQ
jgi:hypothetical protein